MLAPYTNMGFVFTKRGQHHQALTYYQKAAEIAKRVGDEPGLGAAYSRIGVAYYYLGQYNDARCFLEQSLGLFHKVGDKRGLTVSYRYLGGVYEKLRDLKQAVRFMEMAVAIDEELRSPNLEADRKYLNQLKRKLERGFRLW